MSGSDYLRNSLFNHIRYSENGIIYKYLEVWYLVGRYTYTHVEI